MTSFRIVETWTQFSQGSEDGPGSLSNLRETTQKSVWQTWENQPEEFGKNLLVEGLEGLENEFGGDEEFSYELQVFRNGKWEHLGLVRPV